MMLRSLKTFPHVASQQYKITAKGAGIVNLCLTLIQLRLLYTMIRLLEVRERCNLIVVKPRQIMATTLFNGVEYKLSQDIEGLKTLILTHREKVTVEVYENLKRFHEQSPPELRKKALKLNDYKMQFENLSEIVTGVAGTDAGRGFPCLLLQLSELGRCKARHVADIQEGAMQAHAAAERGSMLLVDSTSGGEGNYFHEIAKAGYRNSKSSWYTAFIGWHEMPDYRMTPPKGWVPDQEEVRVMAQLKTDLEQMYWRHVVLHDKLRGNLTAFHREYPATFEEAFESAEGRLIDMVVLINCLNSLTRPDASQPLILGVDPAGQGDRTVLILRQGFYMFEPLIFNKMDDATLANIIEKIMGEKQVDHCFIDMGYGHGTFHLLRSRGRRNITGVHFGGQPTPANKMLYFNKRAEMAGRFQDWCEEGPDGMGGTARLPDHPEFLRDIKMIPDLEYSGDQQKFKLATKEEIKAELGKSPDCFDAAILTFAETVQKLGYGTNIISVPQQTSLLETENTFRTLNGQADGGGVIINPFAKFYSFGGNNGGNDWQQFN